MICKYRCDECMPEWTDFIVRARRPEEDIMEWMKEVQEAVGNAHSIGSFGRCHSGKVDMMVPLPDPDNNEKGIGHQ